ncbi:MAG: UvrD-helicase domain-containing protein [Spirochaetota bacterium]
MDLLANLNNNQKEGVLHTEGPLLILAGAGSGKTRVITNRISYLINHKGVKPYQIFAVTFTNKAAEEMKNRVIDIAGSEGNSVFVKTFHAASVYILRRFGEMIGIPSNFTIYDGTDQESIIKRILAEMKLDPKKVKPSMICSKISEIKDKQNYLEGVDIEKLIPDYFSFNFREIFEKYHEKLAENNALDFNDLLLKTVELFRKSPEALARLQNMWRYFMIDEYQDTNYCQYLIAKYLASETKNICVVGDDDQSIYSWRGADIRNILNFEKDYDNAKIITLEKNYRSTEKILSAAHSVIKNNTSRKEKNIKAHRGDGEPVVWCKVNNEYGEGEFVINTIQSLKYSDNLKNSDFSIFYRTNAQSRVFEDLLRREGIPYRLVGGLKFYDRKEIKDILAYIKFLVNPADSVALFRIINTPARGIGNTSQDRISELAAELGITEWKVVDDELLTGRVPKNLVEFKKIINKLMEDMSRVPKNMALSEFVKYLTEISGYRQSLIDDNSLESNMRIDNIDELINGIYDYEQHNPEATPAQYIQDISLLTSAENPEGELEEKDNSVTLMTVHNAKGLEFPVVFLTGLEENTFPHKFSIDTEEGIEEERRLCYVGITRAMDRIYLLSADIRRSFAGVDYKMPSRFIDEIPPECLQIKNLDSVSYDKRGATRQTYQGTSTWGNRENKSSGFTSKSTYDGEIKRIPVEENSDRSGSNFLVQERVMHPRFGPGRIVKIEGSGDNIKLTINFGLTRKVFMEKYTPLEKMN